MEQTAPVLGPECRAQQTNGPVPSAAINAGMEQVQPLGPKLFRCSVPHCGKLFNRKEHLRRHLKSHNPHPPHECRICGRRYARSDVLKRHIENHPQNPHPRQPRMPPCNSCVERKTRCNGGTPCQACTRASTECIRPTTHWVPNVEEDIEIVMVAVAEEESTTNDSHQKGSSTAQESQSQPQQEPQQQQAQPQQAQPSPPQQQQQQQQQPIPTAVVTTASAPSTTITETTSIHSGAGPDISPLPTANLFTPCATEPTASWLPSDSASQFSWPLLSMASMHLNSTPTADMVNSSMTAGLHLYAQQEGPGPGGHMLASESPDPNILLQGTNSASLDLSPTHNSGSNNSNGDSSSSSGNKNNNNNHNNSGTNSTNPNNSGSGPQPPDMQLADSLALGATALNSRFLEDMSTALHAGLLAGNTNASSPQYSMLSSGSTQISDAMHDPQLQVTDAQTAKRLVDVYFRDVHPLWPILHEPTFSVTKCPPVLLRSVLLLGSLAENGLEHLGMAPAAVNTIMAAQHIVEEQFIPLETLQAMLLCLVYCITNPSRGEMVSRALRLNGFLIAALRYQQVFAGMHDVEEQPIDQEAFQCWLTHEARNRLAYSCLRIDAYISIVLDQPPSIRYFELSIPLPKPASLWSARTEEERMGLQWSMPAGREKALFCNIMRDALEEDNPKRRCYPLSGLDLHLGLCALQVGVWEAAREAHSFASDELSTKLGPGGPIVVWRRHLDFWRQSMEQNGRFVRNYYSGNYCGDVLDEEPFAPLSVILWHVSRMKMHAPIANLQASAAMTSKNKRLSVAAAVPSANFPHFDVCSRIRSWMNVRCSRVSCWNAAQISRAVCHEAADPARAVRLRLNPLACHGLFMASVVVAAYAFYFQSCGGCVVDAASGLPPVVDLFMTEEQDETLQEWWDTGKGYAVWGPKRIPLCRCKVDDLVEWLQTVLMSVDKDLAASFVAFTEKLKLG